MLALRVRALRLRFACLIIDCGIDNTQHTPHKRVASLFDFVHIYISCLSAVCFLFLLPDDDDVHDDRRRSTMMMRWRDLRDIEKKTLNSYGMASERVWLKHKLRLYFYSSSFELLLLLFFAQKKNLWRIEIGTCCEMSVDFFLCVSSSHFAKVRPAAVSTRRHAMPIETTFTVVRETTMIEQEWRAGGIGMTKKNNEAILER